MGSGDRSDDALAATVVPSPALDATSPASDETYPPSTGAVFGPGTRVGRHVLGELLGAGGMGVVYRAQDPDLDRALAVKLVRSRGGGSSGRARLLREAQAMAKLRHPNVVPIFDVGTLGDDVFVVMPFLEGGTLGAWVRAEPRRWTEVVDRYVAAGRGLAAAHAAGLVHRDFKPDNVLVGAGGEVQVADFGLARVEREPVEPSRPPVAASGSVELTRTGDVLGTPAYMAPEQTRGEPSDARADQFSFCVALWESLFGERPFPPGEALGVDSPPPPTPGRRVPGWLRAVLLRGLRSRPADRWPSMNALLDELAARRSARRTRLVLAGAGAIVAAAAIGGLALLPRDRAQPGAEVTYRREPVTRRGDIMEAALSPDGARVAFLAGTQLVVRGLDARAEDRVVRTDLAGVPMLAWSPDGGRVAVGKPNVHSRIEIVDLETGAGETLPVRAGYWAFLSDQELATGLFGDHKISFRDIDDPVTPTAECEIPGEFLWPGQVQVDVARAVLVFEVRDAANRRSLQVMGRDCTHLATISPGAGIASFTLSSATHSILARETRADTDEIIEFAYDGTELGRARVGGDRNTRLIGRVADRYYYLEGNAKTIFQRVTAGGDRRVALTVTTGARAAVATDGASIAWIELLDDRGGDLRVSKVEELQQRRQPIRGDAAAVGWSVDGARLAVTVGDERGFGLVVLDRDGGGSRTLVEGGLSTSSAPAWIDERRIAVPTAENRRYDWVDAETGERGPLVDLDLGWVFDLCRTPDGALAFWLNQQGGRGRQVWWAAPGAAPAATPIAIRSPESVYCQPDGLAIFDADTGKIERADPRSGARTPLFDAQLVPPQQLTDVAALKDGELLLAISEFTSDVSVASPDR